VSLCLTAGAVGYHYGRHLDRSALQDGAQVHALHPERVVLHISDGNPAQFEAALQYAVDFLEQHPESGSRVELIANAGGLNMMRAGVSPYEERIGLLLAANPKLNLLACANAIANLRKVGIKPGIIADIETGETAIDHIVARLQAGWSYVRADALPNI
jgi:hypothetical protein